MTTITAIKSCAATTCAFNQEGCTAFAVTIAGSVNQASCGTFIALDARAGLRSVNGQVGACQRIECVHNADLLCTAQAVDMVGETANCASYQVR